MYHTADASLWYFHAVARYLAYTDDRHTLKILLPVLEHIVDFHRRGTRFGIKMDSDGLLTQGAPGYQLTWMDAKCGDWVVTPRRGKAVEINALWYNALRLLEQWVADDRGRGRRRPSCARWAPGSHQSFNRALLVGPAPPPAGRGRRRAGRRSGAAPQPAVRHLPDPPGAGAASAGRRCWSRWQRALLTPVGLRSLAPDHPDYKRTYHGDLKTRDAAYHQGTVWSYLIGPYVDAWLKVHAQDPKARAAARELLTGLVAHLGDAGIGSVSEVFDAEPPYTARGCMAQAWGVAELLRAWCLTREHRSGAGSRGRLTTTPDSRSGGHHGCHPGPRIHLARYERCVTRFGAPLASGDGRRSGGGRPVGVTAGDDLPSEGDGPAWAAAPAAPAARAAPAAAAARAAGPALPPTACPVIPAIRLTNATGASVQPSIVWTGSGYLVAWGDARGGGDGHLRRPCSHPTARAPAACRTCCWPTPPGWPPARRSPPCRVARLRRGVRGLRQRRRRPATAVSVGARGRRTATRRASRCWSRRRCRCSAGPTWPPGTDKIYVTFRDQVAWAARKTMARLTTLDAAGAASGPGVVVHMPSNGQYPHVAIGPSQVALVYQRENPSAEIVLALFDPGLNMQQEVVVRTRHGQPTPPTRWCSGTPAAGWRPGRTSAPGEAAIFATVVDPQGNAQQAQQAYDENGNWPTIASGGLMTSLIGFYGYPGQRVLLARVEADGSLKPGQVVLDTGKFPAVAYNDQGGVRMMGEYAVVYENTELQEIMFARFECKD